MDFSSISRRNRTVGRLLRAPLALIPKETVLPVLQGQLRGMQWVVGASLHSCWLGSYEIEKQKLVAQYLNKNGVFYDIGANVGFYTLLASRIVGIDGHVYAFEPLPRNIMYLRRHIELNKLQNVRVFDVAVADYTGVTRFEEGERHSMGKIAQNGNFEVSVTMLDSLLAQNEIKPPDLVKIDVEGGELAVLNGAESLFRQHHPVVFLATHSHDLHQSCLKFLTALNYRITEFQSVDGGGELLAY